MTSRLWTGLQASALALAVIATAPAAGAQGLAGPYLAGSQADLRDDYLPASRYYDDAIRVASEDASLLNAAMVVNVIAGRLNRGLDMARRLEPVDGANQLVSLTLLAEALRDEDYAAARRMAEDPARQLNPMFAQLVEGWSRIGEGDFAGGVAVFEGMSGNAAVEIYGKVHLAYAHAFAGDFETAARILDGDDDSPLHVDRLTIATHLVSLSQIDRGSDALELVDRLLANGGADPQLEQMRERLLAGEALEFDQIARPADGAASAYAVLADALLREDALRLSLFYGRLATHIRPRYDQVTALIADILAEQRQYELAIATYEEVAPGSPWYIAAEIGRAAALDGAGRHDEAIEVLSKLSRERPDVISVHNALGDTLRNNEEFARAAEAYSRAVELIEEPAQQHWRLFYVRGISYERTDEWDKAEADFRTALELNPEQPNVLNYLGYSLVELRRNMDEALDMIERAVAQRPQDGYITDSLGWVYYRLDRFDEAVGPMERAVELEPVDPVINDHLGDVLWKVGRKMEARFQWRRALSFEPEEDEAVRIRRKLDAGLDKVLAEEAAIGEEKTAETASGN
ncbi:tetratricopeptide repeat protein [Rhodobacteraceae bacterium 2CG4]|uniref:Tetratricopeptide repeat protein n=1 Tax=Halovulum marinum TaxID=2662447 RepID=A0A6L5YWE3_9RHOB|nr:tetratricopeptide repeat protein [Halovulum marinum]MSU88192.1 tetratricopeptide repeat protein [Halovulum marinum]